MKPAVESAWWVLRVALGLGPLLAGADKFFNILTDWTMYLSPAAAYVLARLTEAREAQLVAAPVGAGELGTIFKGGLV